MTNLELETLEGRSKYSRRYLPASFCIGIAVPFGILFVTFTYST